MEANKKTDNWDEMSDEPEQDANQQAATGAPEDENK